MKSLLALAAAVAVASTVGCANARYVQKTPDEGIVGIPRNNDVWPDYNRTNALKLIERHVGPDYEIVEEREVATGTATTNTQNTKREATANSTLPGLLPAEKDTTTSTTTSQAITEYQIHYRRKAGGLTGFPGVMSPAASGMSLPQNGVVQTGGMTSPPANPGAPTTGFNTLPPPNMSQFGGMPR